MVLRSNTLGDSGAGCSKHFNPRTISSPRKVALTFLDWKDLLSLMVLAYGVVSEFHPGNPQTSWHCLGLDMCSWLGTKFYLIRTLLVNREGTLGNLK